MVPRHEVMSGAEEEKVLKSLGITKEKLPRIKVTDPQCKRLGAKVGDVVRIMRGDLGECDYYRRVVK